MDISWTINPIDVGLGLFIGLGTGLIGAVLTAGYLYHRNSDSANNDALDHVIREMRKNIEKLEGFAANRDALIRSIRGGDYSWFRKFAVPRINATSLFFYAYFDMKAYDAFMQQGYATRVPDGRFEKLALFSLYCDNFNNESQQAEVVLKRQFDGMFPGNMDALDNAIGLFESSTTKADEKYFKNIQDAISDFDPSNKAGLIEPYWRSPGRLRGFLLRTEDRRWAWFGGGPESGIFKKF